MVPCVSGMSTSFAPWGGGIGVSGANICGAATVASVLTRALARVGSVPIWATGTTSWSVSAGPEWQAAQPARSNTWRPAAAGCAGPFEAGGRRLSWNSDMAFSDWPTVSPGRATIRLDVVKRLARG